VFLAVDGVSSESRDAGVGFLRDLVAHGLRPPLLTDTDGAPDLIGAVAGNWQAKHPRSVACVVDDLASLTTFLRRPSRRVPSPLRNPRSRPSLPPQLGRHL
jgi:hypothetical protein